MFHGAHRAWRRPVLHYLFNISLRKTNCQKSSAYSHFKANQVSDIKLRWDVTHQAKSFTTQRLQSSTGENSASWILNDDHGIPPEFWRTWDMDNGTNCSAQSFASQAIHFSYSLCVKTVQPTRYSSQSSIAEFRWSFEGKLNSTCKQTCFLLLKTTDVIWRISKHLLIC